MATCTPPNITNSLARSLSSLLLICLASRAAAYMQEVLSLDAMCALLGLDEVRELSDTEICKALDVDPSAATQPPIDASTLCKEMELEELEERELEAATETVRLGSSSAGDGASSMADTAATPAAASAVARQLAQLLVEQFMQQEFRCGHELTQPEQAAGGRNSAARRVELGVPYVLPRGVKLADAAADGPRGRGGAPSFAYCKPPERHHVQGLEAPRHRRRHALLRPQRPRTVGGGGSGGGSGAAR